MSVALRALLTRVTSLLNGSNADSRAAIAFECAENATFTAFNDVFASDRIFCNSGILRLVFEGL